MDQTTAFKGLTGFELKDDGDGAPTGAVEAVVSVFDERDRDGDVVRSSAFTDGQEVPMAWGHDWSRLVGKGTIRVDKKRARFVGAFFMGTKAGREAHATVKAMGDLQEWSMGYVATKVALVDDPEQYDGQHTREIEEMMTLEVSPVLAGANPNTETIGIKASPSDPQPFKDQIQAAQAHVETLAGRAESLATKRAEDGRVIGEETREGLRQAAAAMGEAKSRIEAVIEDPPDIQEELAQAVLESQLGEAVEVSQAGSS